MACLPAGLGDCAPAPAQAAATSNARSAPKRKGERMMVVTVAELYRRYGRYDEPRTNRAAMLALLLALASAVLLVGSALLYRSHLVGLERAFLVLRWAVYGGIATVLVAVVAIVVAMRRGSGMAIAVV